MNIHRVILLMSFTIGTLLHGYTCNYQELNKPATRKTNQGINTWEDCVALGKKSGPQSNLVVWLDDDNGDFIRGQFAHGPINTAEWHQMNNGEQDKFLQAKQTGSKTPPAGKIATTAPQQPKPKAKKIVQAATPMPTAPSEQPSAKPTQRGKKAQTAEAYNGHASV